jgi:hypothetical protein
MTDTLLCPHISLEAFQTFPNYLGRDFLVGIPNGGGFANQIRHDEFLTEWIGNDGIKRHRKCVL